MKKVFRSADQCISYWLTQQEGRSSNVFFEGNLIYSYGYHYCMAKWFPEQMTFLVNRDRYSAETGKHHNRLRVHHLATHNGHVFYVDDPNGSHEDNAKAMMKSVLSSINRAKSARSRKADHIHSAIQQRKQMLEYGKLFLDKQIDCTEDVVKFLETEECVINLSS